MTEHSEESAARQWLISRPPVIQDLMREFPPGCYVTAIPGAPLCEAHERFRGNFWQVVSYLEDGTLGIAPSCEELDHRSNVLPQYLQIVSYTRNASGQLQDRFWVNAMLQSPKTEAELQAIAQKMAVVLTMATAEPQERAELRVVTIDAPEGEIGGYGFRGFQSRIYQLLRESFPPERGNDEQNHA